MAWRRGSGTTDLELSRVQSSLEDVHIDLYGSDGEHGVIREFRDGKAAQAQRSKDMALLLKLIGFVVTPASVGLLLMSIARALNWVH